MNKKEIMLKMYHKFDNFMIKIKVSELNTLSEQERMHKKEQLLLTAIQEECDKNNITLHEFTEFSFNLLK